ncbi:MAG: hypothetical protein AB7E47_12035 [Desulfovibrionaceae bacterium]
MLRKRMSGALAGIVLPVLLMLSGCASTKPLPQPRRVMDPTTVNGAVLTPRWNIAAVGYGYYGEGLNYKEAGIEPVMLVFKNMAENVPAEGLPVIHVDEVRGVSADGEFLAYSVPEAERLVFASESFGVSAANAAKPGAMGAVVGAGLGALIGMIGGGDQIWKGAAIGGVLGGAAGAATGAIGSESDLKKVISEELYRYVWTEEAAQPNYTKIGYLYFPGTVGIDSVTVTVRQGGDAQTYKLPIAMPAPSAQTVQ